MRRCHQTTIKICALTLYPYLQAPGQRFRIEQWEPYLKKEGIEIDYYSFADEDLLKALPISGSFLTKVLGLTKGFVRRIRDLFLLRKYDVVFIYRAAAIVGPAFFERIIKLVGPPILLDFDDSIFITHTAVTNKAFAWAKCSGKTGKLCRLSKTVTVGNSFLAEYARQFNQNVFVVPTSIDTDTYVPPKIKLKNEGRPIVGWTGSSTSQTHLEAFEPVLAELLKLHDFEIRVISDREPIFSTIPYTWRKWSMETEINEISQFDIGIMPLPDDDWARGKCAFKALQCMSLSIPTICSDVGANRDVIENGANGFLASTTAEWLDCLETLLDDEALREKMGVKARNTVLDRYSMERCAALFADVVKKTVKS